jgi:t-SNARE complex subunit (syntaxin)
MAGRLVCQVCGLAAGSRANRTAIRPSGRSRQQRWRWLVGLVIVVILIAVVMG